MTEDYQMRLGVKALLFSKTFKRYMLLSFAWAFSCILFGLLVLAPIAKLDDFGLYPVIILAILPALPTFLVFILIGAAVDIASIMPEQFMNILGLFVLLLSFMIQGIVVSSIKSRRTNQLKNQRSGG